MSLDARRALHPAAIGGTLRRRPNWTDRFSALAPHRVISRAWASGFMLIEIGLMQRFVLFLGHPVYWAFAWILFTLMLSGALGSALSRRIGKNPATTIGLVIPLIIAASVIYSWALPPLFTTLDWIVAGGAHSSSRSRCCYRLVCCSGCRCRPVCACSARAGRACWRGPGASNGATSILGASAAILIAMTWGFARVATVGAAIYALAWVIGLAMAWSAGRATSVESDLESARPR